MSRCSTKNQDIQMIKIGLVSVTFRQLSAEEIIKLAMEAGLNTIEWGGDIHVPHGNFGQAELVKNLTLNAGLEVASYGSYYRVGESENDGLTFDTVLKTAINLGAPMIRVWAGSIPSTEISSQNRKEIVQDAIRIADLSAEQNIKISFECHENSLTDTQQSALQLMHEIDHPDVFVHWQPYFGQNLEMNLKNLTSLLPWLSNVHIYHCWPTSMDRYPLSEGFDDWLKYLKVLKANSKPQYGLLEFVKDDSPDNFFKDAQVLKFLVAQAGQI